MPSNTLLRKTVRFAVAALMLTPMGAVASSRIFVDSPAVPGDSVTKGFEGQIEVTSISMSAASSPTLKALLAPVVITKPVDGSSPLFMENVLGKSLGTLTVRTLAAGGIGAPPVSFIATIILSDARVLDWRLIDTKGAASLEQISLSVSKYTVKVDKIDSGGTILTPGTPRSVGGQ